MMINFITPDYTPLEILAEIPERNFGGMSETEMAFLCGTIKKFQPMKVVEVGVAAGVTTAVVLEALGRNNMPCKMYSVDLCECFYKDISHKTGYAAVNWLKRHNNSLVEHRMILGKTIAEAIDEIGEDIDFVILDTMHSLPGELLDFISIYPFMTNNSGGVVVFHDVAQSQLGIGGGANGAPFQYASLVTMLAVEGEKYWLRDEMNIADFGNIGAVNFYKNPSNLAMNIDNLFMALRMNWNYIPDKKSLCEYKKRIATSYGEQGLALFEQAIQLNEFSLYRQKKLNYDSFWKI